MVKLPQAVQTAIDQALASRQDPLALFVYDLDALREHVARIMAALPPGVELYYAIKANSEAPVLAAIAPLVDGLEISSGGEIERVAACPTRKPFVFSGPGKLDSDLRAALRQGVEAIHVESLNEIRRLQCLAEEAQQVQAVFIRVNPELPGSLSSKLAMAGAATPFGIDESALAEAVALVDGASHLRLKGFHVHALSHQLLEARHEQLLDLLLERWQQWRALSRAAAGISHLNVGGGIGVNYLGSAQFDWQRLCSYLGQRLAATANAPIVRFEPGRFMAAFCGYYVVQVLDIKSSHGKHFLVCRGGTHQFRLPSAQGHDHPILHLPGEGPGDASGFQSWTVVGQLCTPKDVFSRHCPLAGVRVGDLLVMPLAGAYGYNISHADFLCHPRPAQLFVGAGS